MSDFSTSMNGVTINRELILDVINKNMEFLERKELCKFSQRNPSSADYSDKTYQAIYTIKYFPAYYFEYCILANRLYKYLVNKNVSSVNILSLGSGSCVDYYALCDNFNDISFNYFGVDLNKWDRDLFPRVKNNNFSFFDENALKFKGLDDFDVVFFPKSISNIFGYSMEDGLSESIKLKIERFVIKLISTKRKEIIFCLSYEHFHARKYFKYLAKYLKQKGYYISDSRNSINNAGQAWYVGYKGYSSYLNGYVGANLKDLNENFTYRNIECELECPYDRRCNVIKNSIKTNQYMRYNYFVFTRGNNDSKR